MPKASEIKKGSIVEIDGEPHIARQVEVKSPSSRSGTTLYKIRFVNLRTGQKQDASCKGDDGFGSIDFLRREVQFSFRDGEDYTFMDNEDFSQHTLSGEELGEQAGYLTEGLSGIMALLVEDRLVGIELPQSVNLEIVDTAPGIKGASATGRTKPATLSTGIEIQVPEYLAVGEVVRVNTETGKFMSRA
ncbi:elongation factor P-like protein YeiP [Alkalilimnicola ehrlichii]|uniref:Elongation factor P-like protein n=1 Tax=Alkalilimnicola ehrlichii TaxID=351052 RepID=A0A3E0WWY0_9GAMM|nr:elongation factor P-like protein YeiP [Alkalilimnicola ehrlichii]RFA29839.1 elongation factor P-like protein YeiP [Alkalilimnicola ehrlichii]RFA36427.1 elongation factor P-like protein YeiP [Alkalilimnicola ehrlichii]